MWRTSRSALRFAPRIYRTMPRRFINLHEFQSKKIMMDHGINVQRFGVAESAAEAESKADNLKFNEFVVKAQILAGGRGKGTFSSGLHGGVKLTKSHPQVREIVSQMINYRLVTKQTTNDGVLVKRVMIADALDIDKETYLAILMDRKSNGPVIVGSPEGGVDIEEVAEATPELIYKMPVDIVSGLTDGMALQMAKNLKFTGALEASAAKQIKKLYEMFLEIDCVQVEVNPFGATPDGQVVCFDAKLTFDDNAEFRQKEIFAQQDFSEVDERERAAITHNLNYIGLTGNIGCLVNGAGLAMATMDIIKLCGGEPANFLDVGGGVSEDQVYNAFRILTSDESVRAILVNIFAGIVNCATVANGIVRACKSIDLKLPLVVRLEGNNVDSARSILKSSGLDITTADTFQDAAQKVVSSLT